MMYARKAEYKRNHPYELTPDEKSDDGDIKRLHTTQES